MSIGQVTVRGEICLFVASGIGKLRTESVEHLVAACPRPAENEMRNASTAPEQFRNSIIASK